MALYRIHPALFGETEIDGVLDIAVSDGRTVFRPTSDGNASSYIATTMAENARVTVSTYNIAALLAYTGFGTQQGSFTGYDAMVDETGAKSSSGAVKYDCATAAHIPRTISASNDAPAVGTIEAISFGSAMDVATSATLSAFTPGSDDLFGLGPVSINGQTITGVMNISVNFGIQEYVERSDGDIHNKSVSVIAIQPVITITTMDPTVRAKVMGGSPSPFNGTLCLNGSSGLSLYFRKRSCDGYVPNGTSEHVRLQALNGVVAADSTAGTPRMTTFTVYPRATSSTAEITVNTASAIS